MVQFYLLVTVLLISLDENNVFTGEMVEFGDGTLGLALNLQYQTISVVRFANTFNSTGVMEGSLVRTSGNVAKIPVGHVYINRMVNALGSTIDGKESVEDEEVSRYIESSAPSIMDRRSIHEPFATGLTFQGSGIIKICPFIPGSEAHVLACSTPWSTRSWRCDN